MNQTPEPSADREPESHGTGVMLEAARREKLRKIAALGFDPWGGRFDDHQAIGAIRGRAPEIVYTTESGAQHSPPADADLKAWIVEQPPGEPSGPKVRAAGRIVLQRKKGKLIFLDIRDWSGQIQIFIGRNQVGEENWALAECFDLGDIIGVDGELRLTKTGELTIFAERLHFLTKSLDTPPDKHKGLADPELRHRMRYLDLIHTDGVLERFLRRSKIIQSIRGTLGRQGYVEVEGPTLHAIAGGAAARPFRTHHNALNIPLFMRIALELHLKRLLVGGIERVYELGRVFRNEGISQRHNPEFTMLEVYQAYGDYRTMMDLTEQLIVDAVDAIAPDDKPTSRRVRWGDVEIDFTPPFDRRTYHEVFAEATGIDPTDHAAVARRAQEIGFETEGRHPDVILSDVFEEVAEKLLQRPTFLIDYPATLCPLTKRKVGQPEIAERFELYIAGMEVANAYTELNDPDLQEELFRTQLAGQSAEDSMAKMDHDFIRALRQGMPPAGGLGLGVDRIVMFLTNAQSIREVILFPLFRPEEMTS